MVEVGDFVEWTSQSGGTRKTKRGIVIAVIPAKRPVFPHLPSGLPKSRIKVGSEFSKFDRALVEVPRKTGRGSDYYAPRIKWLKKVGG